MTTTPQPAPAPVKFYLTEVGRNGNGTAVVVGWDYCGRCAKHIANCICPGGVPTEPGYVTAMRKREAEPTVSTGVMHDELKSELKSEETVPTAVVVDQLGPLCTICKLPAPASTADKNDDGTWTHHACQMEGRGE